MRTEKWQKDVVRRKLARVFGDRTTEHLLKIMKEGRLDEVFGSAAIVIKQIAAGTYPSEGSREPPDALL